MDWYYIMDVILLILVVISVPVYMILIYTLIKYRHSDELGSSFFTLSISLGVADISHLLVNWFFSKFGALAWFGFHKLAMLQPGFFAKFTAIVWHYTSYVQKVGVLLAAINRYTVIKNGFDWTPKWVKVSLVVNWAAGLAWTGLWVPFDVSYYNVTHTGGVMWYFEDELWAWRIYILCACVCSGLGGASGVCYLLIFIKVRALRKQNAALVASSSRRAEINLVLVGFVLFVITFICGIYCFVLTIYPSHMLMAMAYPIDSIVFDVYSWINPYLLLVCSSHVRKHFKAVCLCRKVNAVGAK